MADENLSTEVEEIEQAVRLLGRKLDQVLVNQGQILQNQAEQSEILNKILAEVVPSGPGAISKQKVDLEPGK
jgi:hypothetical protein